MKTTILTLISMLIFNSATAQTPAKVDFDAYLQLTKDVGLFRKDKLVDFDTFNQYSHESKVIILDTRSKEMFDKKHIKGALNLCFSDFTQDNLAAIIPSDNRKILIYCNNNIDNDKVNFISKIYVPVSEESIKRNDKKVLLALNTPTFITLYGYGYRNIFELSELVAANDNRIEFEGTDVPQNYKMDDSLLSKIKLQIRDCNHGHICCNVGCSCCTETHKIIKN